MNEMAVENDAPTCDVCGQRATVSDGICGADLCDNEACLDVAWDRAFTTGEEER